MNVYVLFGVFSVSQNLSPNNQASYQDIKRSCFRAHGWTSVQEEDKNLITICKLPEKVFRKNRLTVFCRIPILL